MLDTLVGSPLKDSLAQEIPVAVEQRLEQDWQMPAFWSQLGIDDTNAREDVRGEADSYAFTDAMVLGYALRWVESERADGRSVPVDIALQLEDLGQDQQGRALEIVVDVAGSRLSEIRTLTAEALGRIRLLGVAVRSQAVPHQAGFSSSRLDRPREGARVGLCVALLCRSQRPPDADS